MHIAYARGIWFLRSRGYMIQLVYSGPGGGYVALYAAYVLRVSLDSCRWSKFSFPPPSMWRDPSQVEQDRVAWDEVPMCFLACLLDLGVSVGVGGRSREAVYKVWRKEYEVRQLVKLSVNELRCALLVRHCR